MMDNTDRLNELESEVIQTAIAYHCRRDDGDAKFLFHEACSALIEARYQAIKANTDNQHEPQPPA